MGRGGADVKGARVKLESSLLWKAKCALRQVIRCAGTWLLFCPIRHVRRPQPWGPRYINKRMPVRNVTRHAQPHWRPKGSYCKIAESVEFVLTKLAPSFFFFFKAPDQFEHNQNKRERKAAERPSQEFEFGVRWFAR